MRNRWYRINKAIIFLFIIISALLIFVRCGKSAAKEYADSVNKLCPLKINNNGTLMNVETVNDDTLTFNCMISNVDTNSLKMTKEELLYLWAYDSIFNSLRNEKITGIYRYYESNTRHNVFENVITPDDYLNYKRENHAYLYLKAMANVIKSQQTLSSQNQIDGGYIIDVIAKKPAVLEYKIQFTDVDINELDTVKMRKNDGNIINKSSLLEYIIRQNPYDMARLYKTTFSYFFYDKKGNYIGSVSVTPKDYEDE